MYKLNNKEMIPCFSNFGGPKLKIGENQPHHCLHIKNIHIQKRCTIHQQSMYELSNNAYISQTMIVQIIDCKHHHCLDQKKSSQTHTHRHTQTHRHTHTHTKKKKDTAFTNI